MPFDRSPTPGSSSDRLPDRASEPEILVGPFADGHPPPRPVRPRFQHRYRVHAAWFLATLLTTTVVGVSHYAAFLQGFDARPVRLGFWPLVWSGFWYSGTLLFILGAHELGHYVMCRVHRVDATLPYFLPAPLPLTGTVGAFIKIREAFPGKAQLFDIGVGGPIAGFLALVPALVAGLALSTLEPLPEHFEGLSLGEPLLFRLTSWLVFGPIPDGYSINLHPMGFAAWFGLIATALNLMPFGQLDGGHIVYALLGRRAALVSLLTLVAAILLTFVSTSWAVVTVMLLVMALTVGVRHPRIPDESLPLDRARLVIAVAALAMLALCFTPAPIEPYELIGQP